MTVQTYRDFMTRRDAAEILGVTERTIFARVRTGLLRPARRGDECGVKRTDVLALVSGTRVRSQRAVSRRSLRLLGGRVLRLHDGLRLGIEVLDLQRHPVPIAKDELVGFYRYATVFSAGEWPPGCEPTWAAVFLRLDLESLKAIAASAEDADPWQPFHRLQGRMARASTGETRRLLEAAGSHLTRLSSEWIEKRCGSRSTQAQLKVLGWGPNRALVRLRHESGAHRR